MTFSSIVDAAAELLGITSADGLARIGRHVNAHYKRITSSIGLQPSRRTVVQATATLGVQTLTFTGIEKIHRVEDRSSGRTAILTEVSNEEIAEQSVGDGQPTAYAVYSVAAGSVTILMNTSPQTAFTLYAEGLDRVDTLTDTDEPAFPESFHDILVSAAIYEERLRQEKPQLAQIARAEFEDRIGDLRMFIAKSAQQDIFQGKRPGSSGLASSGGSGSSTNGASSYTQTGLVTFDRDPSAPFAVSAASAKVANLDADLLDGEEATDFHDATQLSGLIPLASLPGHHTTHEPGGTDAISIKLDDLAAPDDNTDLNASSTKHGLSPKSPADATKFLNGAATPAYALVKDSDLSTSDVTTNDVTTAKHGFVPKAPNSTQKFLRGDASFALPAAGTVGAPGVAVGAVDTGVYSSGTGALDFSAGGVKALGIDATRFIDSPTQPRCSVYNSATQSLTDGAVTAIGFDSEDFDVAAMHDTATNNTRVTIPTGADGLYLVIGVIDYASNTTGVRYIGLRKGGSTILGQAQHTPVNGAVTVVTVSALMVLAAADYVELIGRQTSGGALNVGNAARADACSLQVVKLW